MKIGLFANIQKRKVEQVLQSLLNWLIERKVSIVISRELSQFLNMSDRKIQIVDRKDLASESDVMIALGGDGTMLYAARLIGRREIPLLGVNLGGLGFLTEVPVEDLFTRMENLLTEQYTIEKRMVLTAAIQGKQQRDYFALNDVVIERSGSPRVIEIDVTIDGDYFNTYISDGIIVSTPTGSTAYSLSAWGPIVLPTLESIILNPICPHALTVRPIVIPVTSKINLKMISKEENALLSVDGQENVLLSPETPVEVKKGDFYIHLITFKDYCYFDRLRTKLQWGSLPRK